MKGSRAMLASMALAAAIAAGPAPAAALEVGVSDSDDDTFTQAHWSELNVRHGRAVVPYDVALTPPLAGSPEGERRIEFDSWVREAQARGVEPFVAFEASLRASRRTADGLPIAPTRAQFAEAMEAFLRTYPGVRRLAPWNEPNFRDATVNPLLGDPRLAAELWLELRDACARAGASCTVAAGEFAGIPGDDSYVDPYQAALGDARPRLWTFHAHTDANRYQSPEAPDHAPATRYFLSKLGAPWADAEIWINEVGAYYRDATGDVWGDASQRDTTSFILGLATLSPRITRVYYYNYSNECSTFTRCAIQDRGLVSPTPGDGTDPSYDSRGRVRPAHRVIRERGPVIAPSAPPDTAAPQVTLGSPPAGSATSDATPTLSGTAGTAPGDEPGIAVRVWAGASASGEPVQTLSTESAQGGWSVEPSAPLAEGVYTARAEQADAAGNRGLSAPSTFSIDATPPDTVVDSGPGGPTNSSTPAFGFSASEGGSSFECRIDAGAFAPCSSPHVVAALADGGHRFEVRAIDAAANPDPSPASRSFTVDTRAPTVTLLRPAARQVTGDPTPPFAGGAGAAPGDLPEVAVRLWRGPAVAGAPWRSMAARALRGSWSLAASPRLPNGVYSARAVQLDAAGNEGLSPIGTFAVDTRPVTVAPFAAVVQAGRRGRGGVRSLSADDGRYYTVVSVGRRGGATSWYGRLRRVPNGLRSLRITYRGRSSVPCSQVLSLWRWPARGWVRIGVRRVGRREVRIVSSPRWRLADYVSGSRGNGELRLRVSCRRTSGRFSSSADLLTIAYVRP